jgi:hypothetical protein
MEAEQRLIRDLGSGCGKNRVDLVSIWVVLASFLLSESGQVWEILVLRVRPGLCFSARYVLGVARFVSKKGDFVLFLVGIGSGGVPVRGRNPKAESH